MRYRVYHPDPMNPKKWIASEGFDSRDRAEMERQQILKDHPQLGTADVWIAGTLRRRP